MKDKLKEYIHELKEELKQDQDKWNKHMKDINKLKVEFQECKTVGSFSKDNIGKQCKLYKKYDQIIKKINDCKKEFKS